MRSVIKTFRYICFHNHKNIGVQIYSRELSIFVDWKYNPRMDFKYMLNMAVKSLRNVCKVTKTLNEYSILRTFLNTWLLYLHSCKQTQFQLVFLLFTKKSIIIISIFSKLSTFGPPLWIYMQNSLRYFLL